MNVPQAFQGNQRTKHMYEIQLHINTTDSCKFGKRFDVRHIQPPLLENRSQ